MGDSVKIGRFILFGIPYPGFIKKILAMFRSSGRFIWMASYLMFFISMYIVSKHSNSKKIANIIITLCLAIQLFDLYPKLKDKFYYNEINYEIDTKSWELVLKDYKHIACIPLESFDHR